MLIFQKMQHDAIETVDPSLTEAGIDFRPKSYEHGYYRMSNVKQFTGGETLNGPLALATQTSTFELPVKVMNLAKSSLHFNLASVIAATRDLTVAFFALGCPAIDRIQLQTRSGLFLADITDFNFFTEAVLPYATSAKEIWKKSIGRMGISDNVAADAINSSEPAGLIQPGQSLLQNAAAAQNIPNGSRRYNQTIPRSLIEPRYIHDYGAGQHAVGYTPLSGLRYILNFGDIPHSIFSMNKDLFFGETILLVITWATQNHIDYVETNANGTGGNGSALCAASNINLYLAIETNRVVAESVMKQAQIGLKLLCPYVHTQKIITTGTVQQSVLIRLNRGHGRSLLKIYHVPYVTANIENLTYLHSASTTMTDLFTLLDNDRLQDNPVRVANWDFLTQTLHAYRGCCLTSPDGLAHNFLWVDDWTGAPTCDWRTTDSAECGLPLEQERMWNIIFTQVPALGLTNRTFIITQKLLTITSSAITFI